MPELLREATPIARRLHHCQTCYAPIQIGQIYHRDTCIGDGRIYDWIACPPCADLAGIVWDWASRPDDGFGPDEYAEWARDHQDDPEYGERARALLERINA